MSKSVKDLESSERSNVSSTTLLVRGTITAPGAGVAVATLNVPPVGVYDVTIIPRYGATGDVADNMQVSVNNGVILTLPILPAANSAPIPVNFRYTANGIHSIVVSAVATGAGGAVYIAHIFARKIMET